MPINCLIKFLINFWTVMFQKSIHGQFVNNSWTFMFQKDGPFVFHPFVFGGSVAQNGGLSLFNTRPAHVANALKTKDLRKRHFWLNFFVSMETAKTQSVRRKICPMICSLSRRPYTPHAARNWPYMLRRETLHNVGFHVGFADPTLHTQHRW